MATGLKIFVAPTVMIRPCRGKIKELRWASPKTADAEINGLE